MIEIQTSTTRTMDVLTTDVFAAARYLDDLWNSSAKAVSPDLVEWQCTTWGSGQGGGAWEDTALFLLVAEAFNLETGWNDEGRDELVVSVPLSKFEAIAGLIEQLGEEVEAWPWLNEDCDDPLGLAATLLSISADEIAENTDLIATLRIEMPR